MGAAMCPSSEPGNTGPALLLVDAHDSFTWNLVQAFRVLGATVDVVDSDRVSHRDASSGRWDGLVLSPGPGRPEQAGRLLAVVDAALGRIPILGVCLGHQAIGVALGARLQPARELAHGKARPVLHEGSGILRGLPSPFLATRYHSLELDRESLPADLAATASDPHGGVMAVRHASAGAEGVQFHPESILSECGEALLGNFLRDVASGLPRRRASW